MRALPCVVVLFAACATNPVTGKSQLSFYSEAQEIEMGRQSLAAARAETGFYPDAALEKYVSDIGMKMASEAERPGLPWEFHVVDDPAVNAFAAPGGFIFVTRGIMAFLNSEAELASVLGHEIAHVTAKHTVTSLSTQQVLGIGIVGLSVWKPNIGQVAGTAASLGLLSYSRSHESQSDQLGHKYALRDGYDVRDMPNTFRTLQRLGEIGGGSSGKLPSLLSTHPDPGDRIAKTQAWADTITNTRVLHADRDRYLDRMNGLLYGMDPQQGYFEGTRFLHPQLRLRFDIPTGWQGVNQANQVLAVDPNGRGQMVFTIAQQATPDAAAQAFAGQQGIMNPVTQRTTINGAQATIVGFTATTSDNQQLRGESAFIQMGGTVYQFMGLGLLNAWSAVSGPMQASIRSLAPTPANQQFKPRSYLRVVTLSAATTLETLAQRSNGAVTAQMLAIMNGVADGTTLPAGRKIKTVGY